MQTLFQRTIVVATGAILAAGCISTPPRLPADIETLPECQPDARADAAFSVSTLPIQIPADVLTATPLETRALLARRLVVTSTLKWSRISVRTLGGTLEGWTRVDGSGAPLQVEADKGSLTVTRPADSINKRASSLTADVLLLPGGIPIDESITRIRALWDSSGAPLPPDVVHIDLESARHVPGFDVVEGDVILDYVQWEPRTHDACRGSARTRATLADLEAVRPPLWDLGTSSLNAPRTKWLGLRDPASGVFRAVFDSPTAATSFANWIRATHSARIGSYDIGLFERDGQSMRPLVPVDRGATHTFRALTESDEHSLRVGPLGIP